MRGITGFVIGMTVAAAVASSAAAQEYPTKPIRFLLPYPTGGGADAIARNLAQKMSDGLGQQIVADNRPGAGGNIAMELVAKAPPDGYTMTMGLTAQIAVNPNLYKKVGFDPIRDFEPITLLGSQPYVLVVHPSVPAKSVRELVALAKAKPKQLTFASASNGSGAHLAAELMKTIARVDIIHVPYKGAGAAMVDVMGGRVDMMFVTNTASAHHVAAGRLRALAVTSAKRSPALPHLPTMAESGLSGYESTVWYALLTTAGTPRAAVERLHSEAIRALNAPDVRKRLVADGLEPIGSTPEVLAAFIKSELVRWGRIIKGAGVTVD